jgi:outer membrane lipase/esterase
MALASFRRFLPATVVVLAAITSLVAEAGPYSSLVVFGDSLSDNGNNAVAGLYDPSQVITGNSYIPSSTYAPAHTYSNGPVWASDFAALIGLPLAPSLLGGGDFAFGGATTGTPGSGPGGFPYSLRTQADQYLGSTGNVASASALYVVAGGGNNARAALEAVAGGADPTTTFAAAAMGFATDIGVIVDELQAAGAQRIIVWNTPNLGLAPAVVAGGGGAAGSFLAATMNGALALRLAGEAGVSTFDIFGFGSLLAANPSAFGFDNVTDACGAIAAANCSRYAYWDGIHPTAAAHEVIAAEMLSIAVPVPEPETWALILVGLAAVSWNGKRRRRSARAVSAGRGESRA